MTTTLIVLLILFLAGWMIFRVKSDSVVNLHESKPKESPDHLTEPIISYSLYVSDVRQNKRVELKAFRDFPHQYGIMQGQSVELHWNVLNADWISIEGVGFVQAIGKKELFPNQHTTYNLIAKNRNYNNEISFMVRVFPVPVMEKLIVPMPELKKHTIELIKTTVPVINKPDLIRFPSFQIPGVIQIQRDHTVTKPVLETVNTSLIRSTINKEGYTSYKSRLFDKLEYTFNGNYKIKDIVQTIRKHYEK